MSQRACAHTWLVSFCPPRTCAIHKAKAGKVRGIKALASLEVIITHASLRSNLQWYAAPEMRRLNTCFLALYFYFCLKEREILNLCNQNLITETEKRTLLGGIILTFTVS